MEDKIGDLADGDVMKSEVTRVLTSAELSILDVSAFYPMKVENFFESGFHETYNVQHSGLSDVQVVETLKKLSSDGILKVNNVAKDCESELLLTSYGGAVWEFNRKPDWEKYIECFTSVQKEKHETRILGFEPGICFRFLHELIVLREISPNLFSLQSSFCEAAFTYWKGEQKLFTISLISELPSGSSSAPEAESSRKENRFWWSSPSEMITKNENGPKK